MHTQTVRHAAFVETLEARIAPAAINLNLSDLVSSKASESVELRNQTILANRSAEPATSMAMELAT
jgi:hypothetical protein